MRPAFAALVLLALILSAPLRAQPAVPAELSRIPGVTVNYYDVSGSTPRKILAAMKSQRPADSAGKVSPSSSRWSIGIDIRKATTGTRCRVVRATAAFKAEVDFPRLVVTDKAKGDEEPGEEKIDKFLQRWNAHLATLDRQQAAYLRSVHGQLPEVERAAMAGGCEGARAAAERVIAGIRARSSSPAGRP